MKIPLRSALRYFCLSLAIFAIPVFGDTYYVSTTGKEGNDGSADKPWPSVETALAKAGAGHTIIMKAGLYRGPITIAKTAAGTAEHPTIIQAETNWKAVIFVSPQHVIDILADWVNGGWRFQYWAD